jgi:nucleoside-diphosphate-sugar epimerase
MKILVTGGGGFLGRYIVKSLLAQGHQVRIFGRSPQPDLQALGIDVIQGDLANFTSISSAISDRDAIFHVAAKAGIWGSWDSYFSPNVIGTKNVLKACQIHNVQFLIHTSSPSVVFNGQPLQNVNESAPYGKNWLCHYAHTKAIAEQEVLAANSQTLKTTALRPHLIWGKGDKHLIPRIIQRAKAGKLKIIGDGQNLVDIVHVQNAAHAHLLALDALQKGTASGKPYFISQGQPVKLFPWINTLLQHLNIPPITKKISFKKAYFAGLVLESFHKIFLPHKEPLITRFLATELAKDHYFNISNAIKDLHYSPIISTKQGLHELVASLKNSS